MEIQDNVMLSPADVTDFADMYGVWIALMAPAMAGR
jgi:hypothetical protein